MPMSCAPLLMPVRQKDEEGQIDVWAMCYEDGDGKEHADPICILCGYTYCEYCYSSPQEDCKPDPVEVKRMEEHHFEHAGYRVRIGTTYQSREGSLGDRIETEASVPQPTVWIDGRVVERWPRAFPIAFQREKLDQGVRNYIDEYLPKKAAR
jgi:hypothetical protein